MIKITKKALSLMLAMLIACSCMAVASAGNPWAIVLNDENCKLVIDEYGKRIEVKKQELDLDGESWFVSFTATISDTGAELPSYYDTGKGCTVFTLPVDAANITCEIVGKAGENDKEIQAVYHIDVKNSQSAPAAPVPVTITSTSITVKTVSGAEYKLGDKAWQTSAAFSNLTPETSYTIYIRFAETTSAYASAAASVSVKTLASASTTPAQRPKLIDKTKTSITVGVLDAEGKVDANYEYSMDDGKTWQKSGTFTGLTANTMYSFVSREIFDASAQDANEKSEAIRIKTNEKDTYVASLDKATFKITSQPHDDGIYAGDTVGFKVTGDARTNVNDVQYGDTRYVPASFKATQDKPNLTSLANGTGTITTTGKATVTVTVVFDKEKYVGASENDGWVKVGEDTKTFTFTVKEEYNGVKKFFEKFLNIVLDTIPGIIAKIMEMDLLGKLIGLISGK